MTEIQSHTTEDATSVTSAPSIENLRDLQRRIDELKNRSKAPKIRDTNKVQREINEAYYALQDIGPGSADGQVQYTEAVNAMEEIEQNGGGGVFSRVKRFFSRTATGQSIPTQNTENNTQNTDETISESSDKKSLGERLGSFFGKIFRGGNRENTRNNTGLAENVQVGSVLVDSPQKALEKGYKKNMEPLANALKQSVSSGNDVAASLLGTFLSYNQSGVEYKFGNGVGGSTTDCITMVGNAITGSISMLSGGNFSPEEYKQYIETNKAEIGRESAKRFGYSGYADKKVMHSNFVTLGVALEQQGLGKMQSIPLSSGDYRQREANLRQAIKEGGGTAIFSYSKTATSGPDTHGGLAFIDPKTDKIHMVDASSRYKGIGIRDVRELRNKNWAVCSPKDTNIENFAHKQNQNAYMA